MEAKLSDCALGSRLSSHSQVMDRSVLGYQSLHRNHIMFKVDFSYLR